MTNHASMEEIRLTGRTFVTITAYDGGLLITTHKDTEIKRDGKILYIKDPRQANTKVTIGSNVPMPSAAAKMIMSRLGCKNVMLTNNTVIPVNHGPLIQFNSSGPGGRKTSISFSSSRIDDDENDQITKEECTTEHRLECSYDKLRRITTSGSMKTEVLIPVNKAYFIADVNDNANLQLSNTQSFGKLETHVRGHSSISVSATTIETLVTEVSGSGDLTMDEAVDIGNASVSVAGSGDVSFAGSNVGIIKATVAGSGKIDDFTVCDEATLAIAGSGSIRCKATKRTTVKQSVAGSGKIKLTRSK